MGSAGHAFISHTKALSPTPNAADGGYGPPPHPLVVRPGQRYWPRRGKRKLGFVVRRVQGDTAFAVNVDGDRQQRRVGVRSLLARRADLQGASYAFQGYTPRRYATHAYVAAVDRDEVVLCLPEWHPRRAVAVFASVMPESTRIAGLWLSVRCDLSAWSPARLQPHDFAVGADPGPERIERPALGRKGWP